ncbi:MAG: hypothetical protein K8J08_14265 [Thermoanaerobaculia bacterium]|nr:hypothetical protein [Thermoanaerobaculia bacterium]
MTVAVILVVSSAGIVGALGAAHLIMTFWGPKLLPRDRQLAKAMDSVSPVITRQTTVWRAWLGFNASHSLGAILFGLVYGYLALVHGELLFTSPFLQAVGLIFLASLVVLAKVYWFVSPLLGASLALACFLAGLLLH